MLSCDKSLCNVLDYWIVFMVHKNAQTNFTRACLIVTKHWQDSKFASTLQKPLIVGRLVLAIMYFNISLNVPSFHHNWYAYMVSTWMA